MDRLETLRARTPAMTEHLRRLVEAESPSKNLDLVAACAEQIASITAELLGVEPETIELDGRPHVRLQIGDRPSVLVVGHLDTVWPAGTTARWPFLIEGDRATGPGAFDMKSGIVQGLHALSTLPSLDGITLLFNSDEELGSPTSGAYIAELASEAAAALILEPSADGALKIGRKGVAVYSIGVTGRAAHAGLEPEKGANAVVELAHQVLALNALADPEAETSVTPTVVRGGTAANVVPAEAKISVDVRAFTVAEQHRVDAAIRSLEPVVPGTTLTVEGGDPRPPLERAASAALFERAARIASEIGMGELRGVSVGGASDGNITAAAGCPTLDGLGGVGDHAHAEGEYVVLSEMAPRACLVANLVEELLGEAR